MRVEELQAVEIELHGTPRMRFQEIGEILGELGFGEILDTVVEVGADAPDGAGIGLDGLGLELLSNLVFMKWIRRRSDCLYSPRYHL